jgi:hypothetical protein
MRIVTWNLGYMTPGIYKGEAIRDQQWNYLLSLNPEVMLVQECRPDDLAKVQEADASFRTSTRRGRSSSAAAPR